MLAYRPAPLHVRTPAPLPLLAHPTPRARAPGRRIARTRWSAAPRGSCGAAAPRAGALRALRRAPEGRLTPGLWAPGLWAQVVFKGFPSSTGAEEKGGASLFAGDRVATPPEHCAHFSERLLLLPLPFHLNGHRFRGPPPAALGAVRHEGANGSKGRWAWAPRGETEAWLRQAAAAGGGSAAGAGANGTTYDDKQLTTILCSFNRPVRPPTAVRRRGRRESVRATGGDASPPRLPRRVRRRSWTRRRGARGCRSCACARRRCSGCCASRTSRCDRGSVQ